jgi:hypothetical protein
VFYAFGHNQYNLNNKACKENNDCVHAEVDCVSRLKKSEKINPISLIVFRTNNKGDKLLNAKPCINCILKKLCYSDEHGEICVYSDD